MKRDMDLIRAILFKIEEQSQHTILSFDDSLTSGLGHSDDEIDYNLLQMEQGGLITIGSKPMSGPMKIMGMTWAGHDFLDAVRDPDTWAKTKKGAAAAGGFTLDLLKDLAKGLIKKQIEERTGVLL